MHRRQFGQTTLALLAASGLAACKQNTTSTAAEHALSAAQMYPQAGNAHGFSTGPMMTAIHAYIFFDTACRHCAVLWQNLKPLTISARIVWIPVGLLTKSSAPQGAAILAAADPLQRMDQLHAKVTTGDKHAALETSSDPVAIDKVQFNTALLTELGAQGVPFTVYQNAETGAYGSETGYISTAKMAALLGLKNAIQH